MIGAGIFSAFAPAAQAAGPFLLLGLLLAGAVAFANATSSAQLASVYPESGGTYIYGREVLGPWWGYLAGWSFVIGKLASAAAIAMTFAAYTAPVEFQKPAAIGAVTLLTIVNLFGITRTAAMAIVVVVPVLGILLLATGFLFASPQGVGASAPSPTTADAYGILQAAGLLFFAFAGYARIATLGEEVVEPATTIPRAISWSLAITFTLYLGVALALLWALGSVTLAQSAQPLAKAVAHTGQSWLVVAVFVAASLATLGSLLGLIAGISRTGFAMARHGDLPAFLHAVHPSTKVPHRAEILVAIIVVVVLAVSDIRGAIGFSSFGVLLYYFIANIAAWRQPLSQRRYPRGLQVFGALACIVIAFALPWHSVVAGCVALGVGVLYRWVKNRREDLGPSVR